MALGLTVASVLLVGSVSAAAATDDERMIGASQMHVIPYLSHGILTEAGAQAAAAEAIHDPVLTNVVATASQQRRQTPYMSLGLDGVYGDSRELPEPFVTGAADSPRTQVDLRAVRPDDAADRFAHSDVAVRPEPTSDESWRVEWDDALMLTVGTFVLSLALGLGLGYLRRLRLAGL
jgi:hypothetical protein